MKEVYTPVIMWEMPISKLQSTMQTSSNRYSTKTPYKEQHSMRLPNTYQQSRINLKNACAELTPF